ncbi:hypothetical protein AgCh_012916 [Apium graveolens]
MERIRKCQEGVMNQGLDNLTGEEVCTQKDSKDGRPSGLLQPLEIPQWKWEEIAMDFVLHYKKNVHRHRFLADVYAVWQPMLMSVMSILDIGHNPMSLLA